MSVVLEVGAGILVLAAMSLLAIALRRGGKLPARRLLAAAAAGVVVLAALARITRLWTGRSLLGLAAPDGNIPLGGLVMGAGLLALLAAVSLVACMRGDDLAGPSSGAGYGLAFALGGVVGGPLLEVAGGRSDMQEAALLAAALVGAFAVLGAGVGSSRLGASLSAKSGLIAAGIVAGCGAAAAVALAGSGASRGSPEGGMLAACAAALLVVTLATALGWLQERRVLRRELSEEVAFGVIAEELPEIVATLRGVTRADWWPRRDERWAMVELLTQLAFRKHQLRQLDGERASLYSLQVGRLRDRTRRVSAAVCKAPSTGESEG